MLFNWQMVKPILKAFVLLTPSLQFICQLIQQQSQELCGIMLFEVIKALELTYELFSKPCGGYCLFATDSE
jgi:hypothetical protein